MFYIVKYVIKKLQSLIKKIIHGFAKFVLKKKPNKNMEKDKEIITILSYEDFTEMCMKAGGDEFAYREIIKAVVQINQTMQEIIFEQTIER